MLRPEGEALCARIRAFADPERPRPAELARLREGVAPVLVEVALELEAARRRAGRKLGDAAHLLLDLAGLEQATGLGPARHKAARLAACRQDDEVVLDLCCGVGGDLVALAERGPARGVDADPLYAAMAAHNAGVEVVVAAAEGFDVEGAVVHVDPTRREAGAARGRGRRDASLDGHRPGPDLWRRWLDEARALCLKLAPGVALDEVPGADAGELELLAEGRELKQCLLWAGAAAGQPGTRRATMLAPGLEGRVAATLVGRPSLPPLAPALAEAPEGRWLLVPHPSVERAGLVAEALAETGTRAGELHPGLGLLVAEAPAGPWFEAFRIEAVRPWRPERLRRLLRELDAGPVELRTRGRAVDAARERAGLQGRGARRLTVFGLRLGRELRAVVTLRPEDAGGPAGGAG
ncbi:MAG: class I SAM-dependent methyltransferase [Planctomycetota bacterium]